MLLFSFIKILSSVNPKIRWQIDYFVTSQTDSPQQNVNWGFHLLSKAIYLILKDYIYLYRYNLNICLIMEKGRKFQKNIYFCFNDYAKAFGCVDHNKLWKTLEEMGTADHLTCLLRNLYADQEAAVRTGHGTPDWL